jgi:hypothetical protein
MAPSVWRELIGDIGSRFSSEWLVVLFGLRWTPIRPKRYRRDPTGKSLAQLINPSVQPLLKKYSDFPNTQITLYPTPSCPTEGRLEIVTDAGQDAMDARSAPDERAHLRTAKSCGPDASTLASSS